MGKLFETSTLLLLLAATSSLAHAADGQGDVYVTVDKGGGLIFLDGATTGIVAPGVVRGVPAGSHTIRVDEGCRTATADITVRVNAIERVALKPETGMGTVRVEATPFEAVVTDNGQVIGTGSFGPVSLPCGTHALVATAPGRQTVTYTLELTLRGHADVRLDLPTAAIGGIAITPTPLDAEVLVDGVSHGTGPITVDNLPTGVHVVSAQMDGYVTGTQEVTVLAGQIVRSTVELAVEPPPVPVGKRLGLDRVRWGRVGLNLGVSAASVGMGVVAFLEYERATTNYATYTGLTYADDPAGYYDAEVAGPRTTAYVLGGVSGAGAVTSGILWATTRAKPEAVAPTAALSLEVAPSPLGVSVLGRF